MTDDERTVWTADGLEWRWNRDTSLWECLCKVCGENPATREALSLADLEAEHGTVSDWQPRAHGRHSDTRHLDAPAVPARELLARAGWPMTEAV